MIFLKKQVFFVFPKGIYKKKETRRPPFLNALFQVNYFTMNF